MRASFARAVLAALMTGALACNQIFGVRPGEPASSGGDCAPVKPATCDPALLADDENCCVTGRSCQGGTCAGGECSVVTIGASNGGEQAVSIVVHDATVIWSSGGGRSIYATELDGGSRKVLVGPGDTSILDVNMLALDADRGQVYFTDYTGPLIGRVDVAGGNVVEFGKLAGDGPAGLGRILVYEGFVYVAADYQLPGAVPGIYRAPVDAPGPFPVTLEKVLDIQGPFGLAAANGHLYFGDQGTMSIKRVPVATIGAGATPEVVVDNQASLGELAISGDRIYWPVEKVVWAHGLEPGGASLQVYADQAWIWGISADANHVYWTTFDDAAQITSVLRRRDAALAGPATLLYETAPGKRLAGITADCDTVYFAGYDQGSLLEIAK